MAVATAPLARAVDDGAAIAISSKASADYVRQRLADGSLKAETFAFGKGGVWRGAEGGTAADLDFLGVARTVAGPLAGQSYVSSTDPRTTRLLIMVYWGTTRAPDHPTDSVASENLQLATQAMMAANLDSHMVHFNPNDSCAPAEMQQGSQINSAVRTPAQIDMDNAMTGAMAMAAAENSQRDQLNAQNASMLGYDSWWDETAQFKDTALEYRRQDMINELEARRYFVVLMAYDFQLMWKERKVKLLWETRFSIGEKGNDFGKALAAMAGGAAPYFGRNSGKLIHAPLPEGRVEVGAIKTLAFDPQR